MADRLPVRPEVELSALPPVGLLEGLPARFGMTFAAPRGYRPLELDLFVPPGAGPHPVLVWIHGGAWWEGHRRNTSELLGSAAIFGRLTTAGFAVATIDYRLSGEARFPAQLFDVKAAIRWLRYRSAELGIDAGRIAVWGESAGGHLAALAGLTGMNVDLDYRTQIGTGFVPAANDLMAVVDWFGVSDLGTMDEQSPPDSQVRHDEPDSPESHLLGGRVSQFPELVRAANPCVLAHRAAPPFLLMHGTADRTVPYGQSVQLADALQRAGARVRLVASEGADHCFDGAVETESLVDTVLEFLGEARSARRTG